MRSTPVKLWLSEESGAMTRRAGLRASNMSFVSEGHVAILRAKSGHRWRFRWSIGCGLLDEAAAHKEG